MATIILGTNASDFSSLSTLYEIIDTLRNDPTIQPGSTTATATWYQTFDDGQGGTINYDSIVTFHGTGLTTPSGVVTSMDFSVSQNGETFQEITASGLNISSSDMLTAITAADGGNTDALKAVFEGIDWTFDGSSLAADKTVYFQGTGGDDIVTLGASTDQIGLDGGNDTVKLGGGNDEIFFFSALAYGAEGHSTVDGGAGTDVLYLDYFNSFGQPEQAYAHMPAGMKVDLSKTVDFGDFTVTFKNVEQVIGTRYSDTLTGTKGDDILAGGGGGDRITGGGGSDQLSGGDGIDDFFTYVKATDSKAGKSHDIIYGFEAGTDIFDLHKIDPGTKSEAFKFVGDKPLKNIGDLHVEFINKPGSENDYYLVEANLDKDKAAEFQIEVHAIGDIGKADFML